MKEKKTIIELQKDFITGKIKEKDIDFELLMSNLGNVQRIKELKLDIVVKMLISVFPDKEKLYNGLCNLLYIEYKKTCDKMIKEKLGVEIEKLALIMIHKERQLIFYKIKNGSVEDAELLDSIISDKKTFRPDDNSCRKLK